MAEDENLAQEIVSELITVADREAGEQGRLLERSLLESAVNLAKHVHQAGSDDIVDRLQRRIPQSFESEATERVMEGGLIQSVLLQTALELYAQLGMSEDVQ